MLLPLLPLLLRLRAAAIAATMRYALFSLPMCLRLFHVDVT